MLFISLPTCVLDKIRIVFHSRCADGPEVVAEQERLLEHEGLLVVFSRIRGVQVEAVDILAILCGGLFPAAQIPETLALECHFVHAVLVYDGAHTGLCAVVAGVGAVLIPGSLHVRNMGTLTDVVETLEHLGAVRTIGAFHLVDGLGVEQVEVSETDDRIGEESRRDIRSGITRYTVLVRNGTLGEVAGYRALVATELVGILAIAALYIENVLGRELTWGFLQGNWPSHLPPSKPK